MVIICHGINAQVCKLILFLNNILQFEGHLSKLTTNDKYNLLIKRLLAFYSIRSGPMIFWLVITNTCIQLFWISIHNYLENKDWHNFD